jgi:hypothetical protein
MTGFGTFSLSIPNPPPFDALTGAMFGWAIVFGLVAAGLCVAIGRLALAVRPLVERRMLIGVPAAGALVGLLAFVFAEATDKPVSNVLFSGQDQLPGLVAQASSWSVGALVLVFVCKAVAYGLSLAGFRGGPVFPAIFLGAAAGIATADLPGLSLVPAVAMGIGAMSCGMLGLPLTSVLLATLLLGEDGIQAMPVVIVAVVVTYVARAHLAPAPAPAAAPGRPEPGAAPAPGREPASV